MSKPTMPRRRSRSNSVGRLTAAMGKVTFNPQRRKRSKSRRARSKSRGRAAPAQPRQAGFRQVEVFKISKEEITYEVEGQQGIAINLHPAYDGNGGKVFGAPIFASLAKSFARFRWDYLEVEYVSEVSANTDGAVSIGIDWDTAVAKTIDHKTVTARSPNMINSVWKNSRIRVDINAIAMKRWFMTEKISADPGEMMPANIMVYSSAEEKKKTGYIRVRYAIEFAGPIPN